MADWKTNDLPIEKPADGVVLLRYRAVRKALGVKTNKKIFNLVKAGKLVRVRVGIDKQAVRITKPSLDAFLAECAELEATKKEFGISDPQWQALLQAKEREKQQTAMFGKAEPAPDTEGATVVPEEKLITYPGIPGTFAMNSLDYMDPLSRRLIPAGCYIEADESVVCGEIAPCFLERILKIRMHRRGMRTSQARYIADQVSEKVSEFFVQQNEARAGEARRRRENG